MSSQNVKGVHVMSGQKGQLSPSPPMLFVSITFDACSIFMAAGSLDPHSFLRSQQPWALTNKYKFCLFFMSSVHPIECVCQIHNKSHIWCFWRWCWKMFSIITAHATYSACATSYATADTLTFHFSALILLCSLQTAQQWLFLDISMCCAR